MKILMAEDDENIVMIAKMVLEKVGGHSVDVANDGQTALDMAIAGSYDLLILDGMMPKLPGVDVCKQYLEKSQDPKARVIFLSAKSGQDDINEFLELGSGFIQKPFAPESLCQQINDILRDAA